jgi:predicted ArsR family transcriptional regulator
MTNSTKSSKPATSPALLNVIVAVKQAGKPVTAAEVNTTSIVMGRLQKQGLVKVSAQVRSGQRGRPAHIYTLTDKGRGRAVRAIKRGE